MSIPCVWPKKAPQERRVVGTTSGHSDNADELIRSSPAASTSARPISELPELSDPALPVILPATIKSLSYKYETVLSQEEYSLFTHFNEEFTRLLVRPHAHPGFRDHSYIVLSGLNVRCAMDVVLAVSALHLSAKQPKFKLVAIEYYLSAIAGLRAKVEEKIVDGTEDWLLVMVILLCLFEVWLTGPVPHCISSHASF